MDPEARIERARRFLVRYYSKALAPAPEPKLKRPRDPATRDRKREWAALRADPERYHRYLQRKRVWRNRWRRIKGATPSAVSATVDRLVKGLLPDDVLARRAKVLVEDGWTHGEIAAEYGTTRRVVRRLLKSPG